MTADTVNDRHRDKGLGRSLRIAILGTRGIPANYGGFETFAEELSVRLARDGHRVTVYGRSHHIPSGVTTHRGVGIVVLPTIRQKYLDTVVHTLLSTLHALPRRYDIILLCNAANAAFGALPRLLGTPVVLNVDGIERRRRKWNAIGRAWYRLSERLATLLPNVVITDARAIQQYYRDEYGADSTFIPYGSDLERTATHGILDAHALEPGRYFLYVSRLEPENNADVVIGAYNAGRFSRGLAIVGDAPYSRQYIDSLKAMAGPGVTFTGAIYGEGYRELQSHAGVYIHATEVGGTHPALVEAMGFGNCVVVNDVPENREVAGEAAVYFDARDPATLTSALESLEADPKLAERLGGQAAQRAREHFSWDAITTQYEQLFERVIAGAPHPEGNDIA